ncbi:MAG TPA: hypothetical protein VE130_11785 [Nitrososphaeraceae archaeon]|nr:hypothetical protein [Nitrososphaeraceae archaeon]
MIRSVSAECVDPIRTTSPTPAATNSTRRRMNARIRIWPSSASSCTNASICWRSSSITLPGLETRKRKRVRRPKRVPTSPVNCPESKTATRVSTAAVPNGRTISSSPERTTKKGALSPCS